MKWYGQIAYAEEIETDVDVIETKPVEYDYFGDLLKNYKRNNLSDSINTNITISNQLSVVADSRLMKNFHKILYVTFGGAKWTVSSVDVVPPRMILTFGELYKEEPYEEERRTI